MNDGNSTSSNKCNNSEGSGSSADDGGLGRRVHKKKPNTKFNRDGSQAQRDG